MIWSQVDQMTMIQKARADRASVDFRSHHLDSRMVCEILCTGLNMWLHVVNEQLFARTETYKHTTQDT